MRSSRYQLVKDLAQWQFKEKRVRKLLLMITFLESWETTLARGGQKVGRYRYLLEIKGWAFRHSHHRSIACILANASGEKLGWTRVTSTSNRCEVGCWRLLIEKAIGGSL